MFVFEDMRIYGRIVHGSVAEWLKAHDSKSCGRASVSEVRILSLPPGMLKIYEMDIFLFFKKNYGQK